MKVTILMASGKELVFECDDVETTKSRTSHCLSGLTLTGNKSSNFLFINLEHVDAVLYEKNETKKED